MSKKSAIMLGLGIATAVATIPYAAQAGIASARKIEDEEWENGPLPLVEKAKLVWKEWIPTALMCGVSITCFCISNRDLKKKQIAAALAYNLAQTSYDAYKNKVVEKYGEDAHKEVKKEIAYDEVAKTPGYQLQNCTYVFDTGLGDDLIYDMKIGRFFKASKNAVDAAVNEMDRLIIQNGWASMDDFYYELNLAGKGNLLEKIGFNLGEMADGRMMIEWSSIMAPDGTPCLAFDYDPEPEDWANIR